MQTYGFELESYGLTRSELRQAVESVDDAIYEGHFGYHGSRGLGLRDYRADGLVYRWVSESDSSVSNSCRQGMAHEVISPVVYGIEGIRHVKAVMRALRRAGARAANASCGLHVTFGISGCHSRFNRLSAGRQAMALGRIAEAYDYFWAQGFCTIVPQSRRAGSPSYRGYTNRLNLRGPMEYGVGDMNHYRTQVAAGLGRGCLNFANFRHNGTIEFRQHSGTLSGHKIETWALLLHKLVSWAVNDNHVNNGCDLRNYRPDLAGLLEMVNVGDELRRRVLRRQAQLAQNPGRQYRPNNEAYLQAWAHGNTQAGDE